MADRMTKAVEQSLEIIRNRVDQVGVAEPLIQRIGFQTAFSSSCPVSRIRLTAELLGSTAQMSFHHARPGRRRHAAGPRGVDILPGANDGNRYPVESRVAISGERLDDAKVGFDQRTNQPVVDFSFDSLGARQFADITRENVGRPLRSCSTARF